MTDKRRRAAPEATTAFPIDHRLVDEVTAMLSSRELARAVISRVLQAARNELAEMQGAVDTWKMPDFADACCLARARLDFAIDRVNGVRQPGVGGRPRKVAANPPR